MNEPLARLRPEELLKHAAWLRRLAGTLVLDAARAEDVTQQTLLEALERPPGALRHPRAWLATAARNLARSLVRGERRRQSRERVAASAVEQPPADEVVARTALHHEVVGAVLALAEPYRMTLLLRYVENEKPGAIARRMDVPVETVRTRLKRAVELLRGELVRRRACDARPGGASACALALLPLLEPATRKHLRRALLVRSEATATAGGLGAVLISSVKGTIAMSIRWRLAAAAILMACGTVAVVMTHRSAPSVANAGPARATPALAHATAATASADAGRIEAARTRLVADAADAAIRARVVDETGKPIEGVMVGVLEPAAAGQVHADVPPPSFVDGSNATTDSTGACELRLAAADAQRIVDVMALSDGFNPGWWPRARAGDEVYFTLTRAGALSGVVRDLEGTPIAGATIRWVVHGPRRFEAETKSRVDGSYRLAAYPGPLAAFGPDDRAPAWISVSAEGFAAQHFWSLDNVRSDGANQHRLDPWLLRGATIRGRVLDATRGAPIGGAEVWIRPWDPRVGREILRTVSASDGSFVLEHVPAWGVQLVGMRSPGLDVRHLGMLCATAADRGFVQRALEVPDEGAELSIDLEFAEADDARAKSVDGTDARSAGEPATAEDGARLRVHVVDEHGSAIAGAEFTKWIRADSGLSVDGGRRDWETDASGSCVIPTPAEARTAPRRAFLTLQAVGFASAAHDLDSESGDVTIRLQREHRLRGVLRDVDGRPGVADICVVPAVDGPEDLAEEIRSGALWKSTPWEQFARARPAASSGRFLLRGLGPGPWHVAAVRSRGEDVPPDVALAADVSDETEEVELVLAGCAEPSPSHGEPMPPEAECGRVELTLTFTDTGRPVLRAGYVSLRSGKDDLYARPVAPGRFEFGPVRPGRWELRIDVKGAAREVRSVDVAAGATATIQVAVTRGETARGRLDLAALPALESAIVLLQSDDGGGGARCDVGSDGSFDAPGLVPDKTYRMWVWARDREEQTALWISDEPPRAGRNANDWNPRLVPAGVLVVRFFDPRGFPEGVAIRVFDDAGGLVHSVVPAREHGIERVLPAGDYVVRVDVPGLATQEQRVALRQQRGATELFFKVR